MNFVVLDTMPGSGNDLAFPFVRNLKAVGTLSLAMRDRVVLFLGAGASHPLSIPTSEEFVPKYLEGHHEFTDLWNAIASRLSSSGYSLPIDLEAAMTVLDALSSPDPVAYLEEAAGPAPFFYFGNDAPSGVRALSREFGEKSARMAQSLRLFVRQKCERPDFASIQRVYDPLISVLGEGAWSVPHRDPFSFQRYATARGFPIPSFYCFTTNYDLAFERYCRSILKIPIKTGFKDIEGEVSLSRHELLNHDSQYGVLHLHGSVEMLRVSDGSIIPTTTYPPGMTTTSAGVDVEGEAMIYPVLEKQLSRFPFPEVFSSFYDEVRESPLVLFVGFSFRDIPILRLLQDASHPDQKILIISNRAHEIEERLREKLRSKIVAVPTRLGEANVREFIAAKRSE